MEIEKWQAVVGFEGRYEVSDLGHVRSIARAFLTKNGKLEHRRSISLAPAVKKSGYAQVVLCKENKVRYMSVARIVATAFLGVPKLNFHVNHKNGNKLDNRLVNLEWTTPTENQRHAWRTGLMEKVKRPVICVEMKKAFNTITEAAKAIGGESYGICHVLSGKQKRYRGFSFIYSK